MPIDITTVDSPGWWLAQLGARLNRRQPRYKLLDDYYCGDHQLPEGHIRARQAFRNFQRKSRTNYMLPVVDAVWERLKVVGFSTGSGATAATDSEAWRIWQGNHLDADQGILFNTATKFPDAYVIIGPPDPEADPELPIITIEDPREVIVDEDPRNRRKLRAGLKTWVDDLDGRRHAVVYLPDEIHYFIAPLTTNKSTGATYTTRSKRLSGFASWDVEDPQEDNEIGRVPIVRFVGRPQIGNGPVDGASELEGGPIDIQDRINDEVFDRLVIAKMQAYRQRWAKGVKTKDNAGNDVDLPFIPGVDLLWAVEDPLAEFGDFAQSDMTGLLEAIKDDVTALAVLTGLPPSYIQGALVNVGADTVASTQDRLVTKCEDRAEQYGESLEDTISVAFAYLGHTESVGVDSEVVWGDFERRSIAQLADAALKMGATGVPWAERMKFLGFSQQKIAELRAERIKDAQELNEPPADFTGAGGVARAVEPPATTV